MTGDDDPEELDERPSLRVRRPTRVAPPKQRVVEEETGEDAVSLEEGAPGDAGAAAAGVEEGDARARPSADAGQPPESRERASDPSSVVPTGDTSALGSRTHAPHDRQRRAPSERPRARRPSGIEPRSEHVAASPASVPRKEKPSVRPARRVLARASEAPRPIAPTSVVGSSSLPSAGGRPMERGRPADEPSGETRALPSDQLSGSPVEGSGAVLVTGICGRLGRLLARDLHRVDSVIGIDRRPFADRPKDIVFHELDLRRKKTRDIFRSGRVRAVVHLGILHDPRTSARDRHTWNVVAFQKLLEYMTRYQVRKLVVLSSANVYGPQPDNPQFLTEESPLLGSQEFGGIRDLVELDMLAQSHFWRHPDAETVILRPCHIVGSVRNAPSNYLRLGRPITVLGFDPMIQIIHERDVVQAIMMALRPGVRGIFNLRGQGELPLSRILQRLGKRPRPIPGPLARLAVERMWKLHLGSFPSPELDHVRYVCMVDDTRAREVLGFTPRYTLDETLEAVATPS